MKQLLRLKTKQVCQSVATVRVTLPSCRAARSVACSCTGQRCRCGLAPPPGCGVGCLLVEGCGGPSAPLFSCCCCSSCCTVQLTLSLCPSGQQQFRAFALGQRPFLDTRFSDHLRELELRRKSDSIPPSIAFKVPHTGPSTQGMHLLLLLQLILLLLLLLLLLMLLLLLLLLLLHLRLCC